MRFHHSSWKWYYLVLFLSLKGKVKEKEKANRRTMREKLGRGKMQSEARVMQSERTPYSTFCDRHSNNTKYYFHDEL